MCYCHLMARTFLYRCPNTGQTVQGWPADDVIEAEDAYQSVIFLACTLMHLIKLKTGKVLGAEES